MGKKRVVLEGLLSGKEDKRKKLRREIRKTVEDVLFKCSLDFRDFKKTDTGIYTFENIKMVVRSAKSWSSFDGGVVGIEIKILYNRDCYEIYGWDALNQFYRSDYDEIERFKSERKSNVEY